MKLKKAIAREFLWFLATLILAFPLALLFLYFLGFSSETVDMTETEKDYLTALYLVGYILSFLGIYLLRFVALAIQALVAPEA